VAGDAQRGGLQTASTQSLRVLMPQASATPGPTKSAPSLIRNDSADTNAYGASHHHGQPGRASTKPQKTKTKTGVRYASDRPGARQATFREARMSNLAAYRYTASWLPMSIEITSASVISSSSVMRSESLIETECRPSRRPCAACSALGAARAHPTPSHPVGCATEGCAPRPGSTLAAPPRRKQPPGVQARHVAARTPLPQRPRCARFARTPFATSPP